MKKMYIHKNTNKSLSSKNRILIAVGILLAGVAAVFALHALDIITLPRGSNSINSESETSKNDTIKYAPATPEEKKETQQFKETLGNPQQNTPPPSGTKNKVVPIISSWGINPNNGDVEVAGFVSGINDTDGECTLTLQKGSKNVTTTKKSVNDAQGVSCGFIAIARSKLEAGKWQIAISYTSKNNNGTSDQKVEIEVQ